MRIWNWLFGTQKTDPPCEKESKPEPATGVRTTRHQQVAGEVKFSKRRSRYDGFDLEVRLIDGEIDRVVIQEGYCSCLFLSPEDLPAAVEVMRKFLAWLDCYPDSEE